jgi:DNA replication protein DnaC
MRQAGWLQEFVRVHEAQLQPNEVPKAYWDVRIEGIPDKGFKSLAKEYLSGFWDLAEKGKAPALLGRAGTGKTYTAAAITLAVRRALVDTALCNVVLSSRNWNVAVLIHPPAPD